MTALWMRGLRFGQQDLQQSRFGGERDSALAQGVCNRPHHPNQCSHCKGTCVQLFSTRMLAAGVCVNAFMPYMRRFWRASDVIAHETLAFASTYLFRSFRCMIFHYVCNGKKSTINSIYVYVYIYVCVCGVCVYVYVYIYIYIYIILYRVGYICARGKSRRWLYMHACLQHILQWRG
jgi:hypothetical protein